MEIIYGCIHSQVCQKAPKRFLSAPDRVYLSVHLKVNKFGLVGRWQPKKVREERRVKLRVLATQHVLTSGSVEESPRFSIECVHCL